MTTYHLRGTDGTEVFTGTIEPPPGSGSQPHTKEIIQGAQVAVPFQTQTLLTWDTKLSGDDLLDLSVPTAPTIITEGTYAVNLTVDPVVPMTAGTAYQTQLTLDATGDQPNVYQSSSPPLGVINTPAVWLGITWYLEAGAVLNVEVFSDDVAAPAFQLAQANIQRIA